MKDLCKFSILLALSAMAAPVFAAPQPGLVKSGFIYETAPFPECHASTIAEPPGGLVAAWFGGTGERNPDVGIWVARHEDGKWTPPVEVANGVQSETRLTRVGIRFSSNPKRGPCCCFIKWAPVPVRGGACS